MPASVPLSHQWHLLRQLKCCHSTATQLLQAVGSISVPELVRVKSPMEEEYGSTHKPAHTCAMSSASGSGNSLLLVECPRELPQEQAATWARTVLGALQPGAALIAATLPAQHYRGPGSPADDDLVFGLQTAAAAAAAGGGSALPPPLPEATLVGGLAAALLTGCELRQLPAVLVAGVQMQQVPDAQFLYALGQAVQAALGGVAAAGGEAAAATATSALARQQSRAQLLAALAAAADAIYRSSASSSIFS